MRNINNMRMANGGFIKFSEDKGRVFYLKAKIHRGKSIADPILNPPVKYQVVEFKFVDIYKTETIKHGCLEQIVNKLAVPKILRNGRLFDSTKQAGKYLHKYVYHLDR
jgi:hypothetical protein